MGPLDTGSKASTSAAIIFVGFYEIVSEQHFSIGAICYPLGFRGYSRRQPDVLRRRE